MILRLLCALLFLIPTLVSSKEETVTQDNFQVKIPKGWKYSKELMGNDLILFGPKKGPRRPTLALNKIAFIFPRNKEELDQFGKIFVHSKKAQLSSMGVDKMDFLPQSLVYLPNGQRAIRLSVSYSKGKKSFSEESYYFSCGESHYSMDFLFYKQSLKSIKYIQNKFFEIKNGLKCIN